MTYPKWKYRNHPTLGFSQQTLVASAEAESLLDEDWSDFSDGLALPTSDEEATEAKIDMIICGDINA